MFPLALIAHRVVSCSLLLPVSWWITFAQERHRTLPVRGQSGHPVPFAFQMLDGYLVDLLINATYHFLIVTSVQALAPASCDGSGVHTVIER